MDIKETVLLLLVGIVFMSTYCYSAPMENHMGHMDRVPEDVTRFKNFLVEFDKGEIRLMPTLQLLRGKFPLTFQEIHDHSHQQREKREISESDSVEEEEDEEPSLTREPEEPRGTGSQGTAIAAAALEEDDTIKQYVRNEINRIFSCYRRLRCGYTRAQAEQECRWLEHSSLYHQLMKMMGIKNYPKKTPTSSSSSSRSQGGQEKRGRRNPPVAASSTPQTSSGSSSSSSSAADLSINPVHQNLQNGIRYGGVRPGQYREGIFKNRNRRYYDTFFDTNTQLAPLQPPVQSSPVQSNS